MRIHLSGRRARREEIAQVAARLELLGHEVTSRWIGRFGRPAGVNAQFGLTDIARADAMMIFSDEGGTQQKQLQASASASRLVELGWALKANKLLFRVGPAENVFHELDRVVPFETADQMLGHLALARILGEAVKR